jgi:hypothetical protein
METCDINFVKYMLMLCIFSLKIYINLCNTDLIAAEMIKAGGNALRYEIQKLINSIWIKK